METVVLNTGELLTVHDREFCLTEFCVIHNPSDHHMLSWPLTWIQGIGALVRICPHDLLHPDPDCLKAPLIDRFHECDGCCGTVP